MDEEERFEGLVEAAKGVEENALGHVAYSGPLEIERAIDLSPEKYASMNYDDLLNSCDRISKVIKASQLDIYSTGARREVPASEASGQTRSRDVLQMPVKKASELEQQVRKITTESINAAEEMGKELQKAPEIKPPEKVEESFEFEKAFEPLEVEKEEKKPEEEFSFEIERPVERKKAVEKIPAEEEEELAPKPKQPEFEAEGKEERISLPEEEGKPEFAPGKEEKKELQPLQRALQRMRERKTGIMPQAPPVLTAPEEPKNVFEDIKSTFDSEWGGERDEEKIRRKMIELTKELFREKLSSRRDEIKRQITVLKNMLAGGEVKAAKGKKEEQQYSSGLFSALAGTLDSEFASRLNAFSSGAEKGIGAAKERFRNAVAGMPDEEEGERKAALDKLVFELTGIGEKVDMDAEAFLGEMTKKHISAIEQFEQSATDKASKDKAEEKKEEIEEKYKKEAELLRNSIHTRINSIIEDSSRGLIVSERKETKKEREKEDASSIIHEIAEMDEGSLLFYLHAQDLNSYKSFEHKRISRQEAVNLARRLMAKEKGLDESVINKHWGEV